MAYAVIDVETTGLNQFNNDRIVEIGVVLLDYSGQKTHSFSTLVNPERDLGPTHIHKINGSMVLNAPKFEDIAESLVGLLNNRYLIAHNSNFDTRILHQEFLKAGYHVDLGKAIDTVKLSKQAYKFDNYKLNYLCQQLNIPLENYHSAESDAIATASLFQKIITKQHITVDIAPVSGFDATINLDNWLSRKAVLTEKLSLQTFIENLPRGASGTETNIHSEVIDEYLTLLHKSFINKSISAHNFNIIKSYLSGRSLSQEQVINLNEEYLLLHLCKQLQINRKWQSFEELAYISDVLNVPSQELKALLQALHHNTHLIKTNTLLLDSLFTITSDDSISFTGEGLLYSKAEWEMYLKAKGYKVTASVLQSTTILVTSDVESQSSKAKKARSQNTLIMHETIFSEYMGKPY